MQSGSSFVSIPLSFVPLHIPGLHIDSWVKRGIYLLEDLYDGYTLKPFVDIQHKYGLPSLDNFKYIPMAHLVKSLISKQCNIPSQVLSFMTD